MASQKVEIDNLGDNNFSKLNPRTVGLVAFYEPTILAVFKFAAATASLCVTGYTATEF